jgi:hypothetical protein
MLASRFDAERCGRFSSAVEDVVRQNPQGEAGLADRRRQQSKDPNIVVNDFRVSHCE